MSRLPLPRTAVFPNRYIQGANILPQLAPELAKLGKRALIIGGKSAASSIIPPLLDDWRLHLAIHIAQFHGECSRQEVDRLTTLARQNQSDIIVAMGGGKAIDTAKAVAHNLSAASIIVPTIASTDAPTSAVSVLYTPDGQFDTYLFFPRNPDLVFVDTQIIAQAPVRFLIAGMGDGLATWFEADACRQSYSPNQCGGLATLAGYAIARLCYDTLLEFGLAAKLACQQHVVTPALDHVIEANTLLSGLGFESGGLSAAHSIHNGLTMLAETHHFYHGEKVAIGTLAGLFLADRSRAQIDEAYSFCEAVGLPTTLAHIGLPSITPSQLDTVATRACAPGETIHHEPAPILPSQVTAALLAADAYGRTRLAKP